MNVSVSIDGQLLIPSLLECVSVLIRSRHSNVSSARSFVRSSSTSALMLSHPRSYSHDAFLFFFCGNWPFLVRAQFYIHIIEEHIKNKRETNIDI